MMTKILRHTPEDFGVVLDPVDGSCSLNILLEAVQAQSKWAWVKQEDIEQVVRNSDKQRFEIEGGCIRARYGHSHDKVQYAPADPPAILYHGTNKKALPSILKEGLSPMIRQYVHLSEGTHFATLAGSRRGELVILKVDTISAMQLGVNFYYAGNEVWLADRVPPESCSVMETIEKGQSNLNMNPPIVDIGVNLMHRTFHQDREQVVERAIANHVTPLIKTGTSLRNSIDAARYAGRYSGKLYATAGVHPHDAKSCNEETITKLKELAALPQVVAIGECGLDYNRDFSPRDVQRKWFTEQIRLALELNMPLFLHERDAFSDFIAILKEHSVQKAVVHCFTGTHSELKTYLEMGFYIGITGWICDERRGKHLRELVRMIPPNRLMIETDAPFLTPRDLKEKPTDGRNEPAFLPHILQAVARCTGRPAEEVAKATTETAAEFFGI